MLSALIHKGAAPIAAPYTAFFVSPLHEKPSGNSSWLVCVSVLLLSRAGVCQRRRRRWRRNERLVIRGCAVRAQSLIKQGAADSNQRERPEPPHPGQHRDSSVTQQEPNPGQG
jgi:hypothetical protein